MGPVLRPDPINVLSFEVILSHMIPQSAGLSIAKLDLACLGVTVMLLLPLLDGELHSVRVILGVLLSEEASDIVGCRGGHNFIHMRRGGQRVIINYASLNRWYQSSSHFLAFLETILLFLI